jgi:ABC-type branched-subunit amino acid transport system ATPase component
MLSGGQKQKLAWGMSVLNDVSLLLSDEASAGSSENLAISSQQSACFVEHN